MSEMITIGDTVYGIRRCGHLVQVGERCPVCPFGGLGRPAAAAKEPPPAATEPCRVCFGAQTLNAQIFPTYATAPNGRRWQAGRQAVVCPACDGSGRQSATAVPLVRACLICAEPLHDVSTEGWFCVPCYENVIDVPLRLLFFNRRVIGVRRDGEA